MAIAIEKLEDHLNCPMCLDTYTKPKQLQCHHVYCQQCLVKLVFRDQQGQLSLACPNCRQVTLVPANGVRGLQSAFQITPLLEILDEHKKSKSAIASAEKIESASMRPTPHGDTTLQEDVTSVCPEHDGKKVALYCETCEETICWKCIKKGEKHNNHNYEELDEAFEIYEREIMSSLEPVEKQLLAIEKAVVELDARHTKISNQQTAIEADIHNTITRLQETLEVRKTELISQLHQLTQTKLKSLAIQRDLLEATQAQLSSCLCLMKENLTTGNQGKALLMKRTTVRQVKQISTLQLDMLEPNTEADLIFSALADLTKECRNYGKVFALSLPDPLCHVTSKGFDIGSPDPFKVHGTGKGVETGSPDPFECHGMDIRVTSLKMP